MWSWFIFYVTVRTSSSSSARTQAPAQFYHRKRWWGDGRWRGSWCFDLFNPLHNVLAFIMDPKSSRGAITGSWKSGSGGLCFLLSSSPPPPRVKTQCHQQKRQHHPESCGLCCFPWGGAGRRRGREGSCEGQWQCDRATDPRQSGFRCKLSKRVWAVRCVRLCQVWCRLHHWGWGDPTLWGRRVEVLEPSDQNQRQVPSSDMGAECLLLDWMRLQILRPSPWTPSHSSCWITLHGHWNVIDWATGGGSMEAMA